MPLGMHQQTLFSRECAFDWLLQQPSAEGRMSLIAHVFLATKRATVSHQFDGDLGIIEVEHFGNVVAVVPDTLTARIHVHRLSVTGRYCNSALRLQKRVFNTLRNKSFFNNVSTRTHCDFCITSFVATRAQDVVVSFPDSNLATRNCSYWISKWSVHGVLHIDELCSGSSLVSCFSNDDCKNIACI